ncbi:MAG: 50S ribosomal protein L17 [Desulfobacterales bacterium]|nr:50S ribosomal protein L17 [Desulfobacterales bacterium]
MRHQNAGSKFNRDSSHRKAMFRNMVTSLLKHDRIRTTDAKAKALRSWADHLITLAKRGDLHARRQALAIVYESDVVHKLFDEAPKRFGSISGGYTRVVKLDRRPGDATMMSLIELVSGEEKAKKKKTTKKKSEPKAVPVVPQPVEEKSIQAPKEADAETTEEKVAVAAETQEPAVDGDALVDSADEGEAPATEK